MQLMRRHDPQAEEEGFHLLLPYAAEHIDELIAEFFQEGHDHGVRFWLLELIGQGRSPKALSVLTEQIYAPGARTAFAAANGHQLLLGLSTLTLLPELPELPEPPPQRRSPAR